MVLALSSGAVGSIRAANQDLAGDPGPKSLDRLPNELLISILTKSADFSSLNSLIQSSSRLYLLFRNNARAIVEAVLTATVPVQIESIMRAVL